MPWRLREALDAADFVISNWERRVDRAIGANRRRAVSKYAALIVIGIPVAYAGDGFRFGPVAAAGLAAGIALYAAIDAVRRATASKP